MSSVFPKVFQKNLSPKTVLIIFIVLGVIFTAVFYSILQSSNTRYEITIEKLSKQLKEAKKALEDLKNVDQVKRNDALEEEIANIQKTYDKTVVSYESLLELKTKTKDTAALDKLLSEALSLLSKRNYSSAAADLKDLDGKIAAENAKIASQFSIPANVKESNSAPSSGYSRQKVNSDVGEFLVDIISGDLSSTRVIIDTASDATCANNCPVMSLGDYVARSGAYAGVNGSYFCPESYPSCAGKTNSFDTLVMNKNKVYFNSDNNVYSTVPVAVFGNGSARFIGQSSGWGRDTGVDGVIANQPLILSGGNVTFGGDGDPKKGSRGARSFVGASGSKVYIGVVHNATVAEVGHVLKTLGLSDALNLDSGGSTALWNGGYKVGPGRNIPNAVLFQRR